MSGFYTFSGQCFLQKWCHSWSNGKNKQTQNTINQCYADFHIKRIPSWCHNLHRNLLSLVNILSPCVLNTVVKLEEVQGKWQTKQAFNMLTMNRQINKHVHKPSIRRSFLRKQEIEMQHSQGLELNPSWNSEQFSQKTEWKRRESGFACQTEICSWPMQ